MIESMTGFARQESQGNWGCLTWEIRSVNHRFLDMFFRLPESFRHLESKLRNKVQEKIHRGKIELTLNYQESPDFSPGIQVNEALAKELKQACQKITTLFSETAAIDPLLILKWPGVVQIQKADLSLIEIETLALLDKTLMQLSNVRQQEGISLSNFIADKITKMQTEVTQLTQRIPQVNQHIRTKLLDKLQELAIKVDANRIEQEIAFQLQRIDVTEELERLQMHLQEVNNTLHEGGVIGRRLDFLMQELHRETNTLGAKSVDAPTSAKIVDVKVLVEQMREQVQNIA